MDSNTADQKDLRIERVSKRFGHVQAVDAITLEVAASEFFTLLGPSGCGKTTLLRIIAGLEMPDQGRLFIGGENITDLPATKRQVNTVFQSYALFPHLTVFENVAFGLRSRKFPAKIIDQRVYGRLEMLGIDQMALRHPDQLSRGQKQRVALARALVNEPDVLLLDEPMSALDAKLRAQVQVELRRLQQELGKTFILVTHDQDEALVVSDRIAVMDNGRVVQHGTPEAVYDDPETRFVAEFLGAANLLKGRVIGDGIETEVGFLKLEKQPSWSEGTVAIRPEWIRILEQPPVVNGVHATIREVLFRGTDYDLRLDPGRLRVRTHTYRNYQPGDQIWLELAPEELAILNE